MADIAIPEWMTDKEERAAAEACTLKHTKYQPTPEEFHCPKCEAPAGDFCVEGSGNYDCPLLHDDDELACYGKNGDGCKAQYGTDGKTLARNIAKKKNLVKCEHCKGSGYVKGK